jgi:predicted RNA-binding protein with PUA domain
LDSFIKAKREEVSSVENARQDLLEDWKIISSHKSEPDLERFVIIEGNQKIYTKILQMMKDTETQFSA